MAPGFAIAVEPLEHALLDVHVLEDRFDDEIGLGQGAEVERGESLPIRSSTSAIVSRPFLAVVLVVAAHDGDAAVERLLRGLDDRDRDAGAEEIHGDAAAHGAGADHADAADRRVGSSAADVGDLRRLPLGEEHVPLRLGLRGLQGAP